MWALKLALVVCLLDTAELIWKDVTECRSASVVNETNVDDCNLDPNLIQEIAGYQDKVDTIIDHVVKGQMKGYVYKFLDQFGDIFGGRMSGSSALESFLDFMVCEANAMGLDNVHGEDVLVPHWERGEESATMLKPYVKKLHILGLGLSVGTPPEGITADGITIKAFDDLRRSTARYKGKIVVVNQDFVNYFQSSYFRLSSAVEVAKVGALAVLIKSVTPFSLSTPHTGVQYYDNDTKQIPVACISVEDAELMHRLEQKGQKLQINLKMGAQRRDDAYSRNVIADIKGSKMPHKVVMVSAHSDSWDVGEGVIDDGGGMAVSWGALVLLKELGFIPRRTVRMMLWATEEFGYMGVLDYIKRHNDDLTDINFAMESDFGTYTPLGINYSGSKIGACVLYEVLKLMTKINATKFQSPLFGGPDVAHLVRLGVPGASLIHNANDLYFWFHHTSADSMTAENPNSLDLVTALWAAVAYVIADISLDIPHKPPTKSDIDAYSYIEPLFAV